MINENRAGEKNRLFNRSFLDVFNEIFGYLWIFLVDFRRGIFVKYYEIFGGFLKN